MNFFSYSYGILSCWARRFALPIGMLAIIGCQHDAQLDGRPGKASTEIAKDLSGYLVWENGLGDILAKRFPDLTESVVRASIKKGSDQYPHVHAVSGPDSTGRIAFLENYYFVSNDTDQKHLLKVVGVDGNDEETVFSRPTALSWNNGQEVLALSAHGGKAAILTGLRQKQMPDALLYEGRIEIWDINSKAVLNVSAPAINDSLSWFPDGDRLAYVRLVTGKERSQLSERPPTLDELSKEWSEVPAVFVLDLNDGTSSFLDFGWHPVVGADGNTVLIGRRGRGRGSRMTWYAIDVEAKTTSGVAFPGCYAPLALTKGSIGIYFSSPTPGEPNAYTDSNSPLVGPKKMIAIKAAQINAEEFQTIIPSVDPRRSVSFGRVEREK